MRKLVEVQEAKALMNDAMDWSAFKWLFEKSRVREVADQAKVALDAMERAVKARWSEEAKAAYQNFATKTAKSTRKGQTNPKQEQTLDPEILILVEKLVDADNAAEEAGMAAEDAFDEAEKQFSIPMAQEGCRRAIHAWALREKAIRKAGVVAEKLRAESAASSLPREEQ